MKITGIILAGGANKRMGREKGFVNFLGKPMIEHIIDAIKPICKKIIISANNRDYESFGYPVVSDHFRDTGPSAGIIQGLIKSKTETNLIVPCDMPLLSSLFLQRLITLSDSYDITVTVFEDQVQPLCGVYKKYIVEELELLVKNGEKSMIGLIDHFKTNYVYDNDLPEFEFSQLLRDFNTKKEIKNYLKSIQENKQDIYS